MVHFPMLRHGSAPQTRMLTLALAAGLLLALAPVSGAATYTWSNPAGGAWSDGANWSPTGVPGSSDVAVLGALSGPYQVSLDASPSVAELDITGDATLDDGAYDLASVIQLHNAGTILNFRGYYDGYRVHNDAGGTIRLGMADSVEVSGDITNDGTLVIGSNLQNALYLLGTTSFSGAGSIVLAGRSRVNCPLERPQTDIWLNNGAGHTLTGAGDAWVPVHNYGTLLEDGSHGAQLTVHQLLYNYGTVRVSGGATVDVDYPLAKQYGGTIVGSGGNFLVLISNGNTGTIDNLHGGTFVADGGDLGITAGTIASGTVTSTGGAGAVVILTVATPSNLVVQPGAELRVDGLMDVGVNGSTIDNHGIVRVRGTLNIDGPATNTIAFTGDGMVVMDGGSLGTPAGATLTNGPGQTITGCGTITANIDNQGTIDIDCGGYTPAAMREGRITNRGLIHVKRGVLTLNGGGTVVNRGTIDGDAGQLLIRDGATLDNSAGTLRAGVNNVYLGFRSTTGTIVGGTLATNGAGNYQGLGPAVLRDVTLDANATYHTLAGGTTQATGLAFHNLGLNQVDLGGAFTVDPAADYVQASGTTFLNGGTLTVPRGLTLSGALRGFGKIVGDVTNQGTITPDVGATGLAVQGNFRQAPGGSVAFVITGTDADQYARLTVSGVATLDGQAAVTAGEGFLPTAGQAFQVMGFAAHAGAFAALAADPALAISASYTPTNVTLQSSSTVGVGDPGIVPRTLRFVARGAHFALELPEAAHVTVRVYTAGGREIGVLADDARAAGASTLDWSALHVRPASGLYFARATVEFKDRTEDRTARAVYVR